MGLWLLLAGSFPLIAQSADGASRPIYVDDHCQVLGSRSSQFQADPDVCHFDGAGMQRSTHLAAKEVDGMRQHTLVNIAEQTYMLQDIESEPVVFVVAQQVPEGWHVDSDPQPVQVKNNVAIFRVTAKPGQIVRLHVGVAHETPIRDAAADEP
ncbi:MAG TPA: hypothetical protein VIY53_02795 [Acidobacteriaceae bacterium]